ncbi:MAG: glycosyltransferase family 9 protein [Puia sp.]|nr:glycosyltransferase family 9 protein [Puia sp.]
MQKFLIIQTAFIGDVVLATGLIEKLHASFPGASIDFLVRKGNEALLIGHPYLREVLVWNKKEHKFRNLWKMMRRIRREKYDTVINVQRFAATGLLTALSGAGQTIGFDKNPLSRFFTHRIPHVVGEGSAAAYGVAEAPSRETVHEIVRNQALIRAFTGPEPAKPRLYPTLQDAVRVGEFKRSAYLTISPASVWFTKQYPADKWVSFIDKIPAHFTIYLLGAGSDKELCETILDTAVRPGLTDLSGRLSFLQSAALMKDAVMNYVNDSAPMHFASAMNAPVTAVYCSTLPSFGFGPLSDQRFIVEIPETLSCRPCGLHGRKACPLGHFHCARKITEEQLLHPILNDFNSFLLPSR